MKKILYILLFVLVPRLYALNNFNWNRPDYYTTQLSTSASVTNNYTVYSPTAQINMGNYRIYTSSSIEGVKKIVFSDNTVMTSTSSFSGGGGGGGGGYWIGTATSPLNMANYHISTSSGIQMSGFIENGVVYDLGMEEFISQYKFLSSSVVPITLRTSVLGLFKTNPQSRYKLDVGGNIGNVGYGLNTSSITFANGSVQTTAADALSIASATSTLRTDLNAINTTYASGVWGSTGTAITVKGSTITLDAYSDTVNIAAQYQTLVSATPNLTSYWKLDNASTDSIAGSTYTLVRVGAGTEFTSENLAGTFTTYASTFSGSGQYYTLGESPRYKPANFTIECWMYPNSIATYAGIFAKTTGGSWNDGYGITSLGGSSLSFWVNNYGTAGNRVTFTPTLNTWTHMVCGYDGGALYIIANGVVVDTKTFTTAVSHSNGTIYVGNAPSGAVWNGKIDELAFYNRGLTLAEAQAHYVGRLATSSAPRGLITLTNSGTSNTDVFISTGILYTPYGVSKGAVGSTNFYPNITDTNTWTAPQTISSTMTISNPSGSATSLLLQNTADSSHYFYKTSDANTFLRGDGQAKCALFECVGTTNLDAAVYLTTDFGFRWGSSAAWQFRSNGTMQMGLAVNNSAYRGFFDIVNWDKLGSTIHSDLALHPTMALWNNGCTNYMYLCSSATAATFDTNHAGGYVFEGVSGSSVTIKNNLVVNGSVNYGHLVITTANSPYSVKNTDNIIVSSCTAGNITINLPSSTVLTNCKLTICNVGNSTNTVTINALAGQYINRVSSQTIYTDESVQLTTTGITGNEWVVH